MYLKGKLFRDDQYLDFVRQRPCLVSGSSHNVVAHHVRIGQSGGMGIKPSDYRCLPIDYQLHMILHNVGEKTFWKDHKIDPFKEIITQLFVYLSQEVVHASREDGIRAIEDSIWHLKTSKKKGLTF